MTTAALMKAEARAAGEAAGEAKGRTEGKAEGRTEGKAVGRLMGGIATLETILNLPATPQEVLELMTQSELEAALQKLQTKYRERVPEPK